MISQSPNFQCLTPDPIPETQTPTTSSGYCDISGYTGDEYIEDLSIVWVDVNFHFVGDGTNEVFHCDENGDPDLYAPEIVRRIINHGNNNFGDPCLNNIVQSDRVEDTRIRYRIFEADGDPCTGIYFYNNNPNITPSTYPNGNQTLNIVFRNQNGNPSNPCEIRGYGPSNIEMYNYLAAIKAGCESDIWNYARTVNHEFGHVLGLSHSFSCGNHCDGIDMDEALECHTAPCGFLVCNNWASGSNNFMGYNGARCAITPCQWERMIDRLVNRQDRYANFCDDDSQGPRIIGSGTNEVWNDHVYLLNRDVIVETGSTLTINCEVRMGEGKTIIVQRGAKLVVDGGKISNLCEDTFWEGIVVYGNANQEQPNENDILQPDDAGVVHIKNNSRIEYAEKAVRAAGEGVLGYANRIAHWGGLIIAENSHFTNNKKAAGFKAYDFPNKSKFINCTFEQLPDLDYDLSYGVSIWACHGILFEGNTFRNLGRAAIEGADFSAKILTGNTFESLFPAIWIRSKVSIPGVNPIEIGGGQTGNNFVNCTVGIYVTGTNQLNNLIVKNNQFTGGNIGLFIDGPSKFTAEGNAFGGEDIEKGMDQGIMTINTGREFNLAECNNFENVCIPIEAEGSNDNFSFLGNEFISASSNVRVSGSNGNPGIVRSQQGTEDDTPNNCFGSGIDIETVGTTEFFQYFIPNNPNAPVCLFPMVSGNNYITQFGFSDLEVCGEIEFIPEPPFTPADLAAARDSVTDAENILSIYPQNQAALSKLNKWSEIKDVELRWLIEDRVGQQNYTGAETIVDGEAPTVSKKLKYSIRLAEEDYQAAKTMLLTIPTNNQEDADFVTTQIMVIESMDSNIPYELTNSQKATLQTIKQGTTSSRGTADALLWRYVQEGYNDELTGICENCGCGEQGKENERSSIITKNQNYRIFPNPVNSILTVEYPADIDVEGKTYLRLYSIHGQELLNLRINGDGRQQIDLSEIPEGVYFLTIQNKEDLLYQDKLIIIK